MEQTRPGGLPARKRHRGSLQGGMTVGDGARTSAYEILGDLYSAFGQVESIVRERLAANEQQREAAEEEKRAWDEAINERQRLLNEEYKVPAGALYDRATTPVELVIGGKRFTAPVVMLTRIPETLFTILLRKAALARLEAAAAVATRSPPAPRKRPYSAIAGGEEGADGDDLPADGTRDVPLRVTLDRDPTFFEKVLRYLASPDDFSLVGTPREDAERIRREADFYGLPGLRRLAIRCTSLVVSKQRDSPFMTIAAAVAAAVNGDKIVVLPGRYEENIATTKRIEICGEGGADGVVEICTKQGCPTVLFSGSGGGVLRNVSLREASPFGVALVEVQGKASVLIDNCDLSTAQSANAINVVDEASLHLVNSAVHDVKGSGVFLRDTATATLRGNTITNMESCGLFTRHHTRFYLENNTIEHAALGGVDINDFSLGTIEACTFRHCLRGGLVFYGSSHIRVKGNTVTHNEYGMRSFESSQVILSANTIKDNKVAELQGTALNRAVAEEGGVGADAS